jgi:hypothetical protein
MAKQSIIQLKNWFVTQAKPIQNQFWDWLDSFRHKDDKIAVDDLEASLKDLILNTPDSNTVNTAITNEATTRAAADTALAADIATKVSKWQHWEGLFVAKDATTGKMIFKADPANGLAQLGDFGNVGNSTFISVDDANGVIIANAANGFRGAGSVWQLSSNGDAKFANATITSLTSTMLKVNSAGKLVAAVAGTDYQTPIGYSPVNKAGDTMLGHLTLVGDAVNALHPITKSQFDNLQTGLSWKYSARASTVAALPSYTVSGDFLTLTATANGALTLDGVTLSVGDRILVKNESGAARINNGAYTVTQVGSVSQPYILTRTTAANTSDGLTAATFYVREGSVEANRIYAINTNPVTLGTTQITFALVAGAGTYANGTGLDLTGNVFSIANAGVSNAMLAGGISDSKISSAASWNAAFNSRISNFTTIGNSGAATFSSNVLNIPNYTIGGLGGLPLTGGTITNPVTIGTTNYNVPITVVQGDYRVFGVPNTYTSMAGGGMVAGTYTNVAPTGGSGTGLLVTVVVSSSSFAAISATTAGTGYLVGDVLTIPNTALGGTTGTQTLTILQVTSSNSVSDQNAPIVFRNYLTIANSGAEASAVFTPTARFEVLNRSNQALGSSLLIGLQWAGGSNPFMAFRYNNINMMTFGSSQPLFHAGLTSNGTTTFNGSTNFNVNPTFGGGGPSIFGMGININNTSSYGLINAIAQNNNSTLNYRPATMYGSNTTQVRGSVASLTITNAGTGGTNAASPIGLSFTGGSGIGLSVNGTIVGGSLATLSVSTNQQQQAGRDFVQGETINITGNGLIGATATVNLISIPTTAFNANDIFNSNSTNPYHAFRGTPTINQTGGATGDITGYFWNPTLTSLQGRNLFLWGVTGDALMCTTSGRAAIGTDTPHASALLTLSSTTRGLLLPRMTKTQRDAISSPAAGLALFQTDNAPGLRCFNGTNWVRYTETND